MKDKDQKPPAPETNVAPVETIAPQTETIAPSAETAPQVSQGPSEGVRVGGHTIEVPQRVVAREPEPPHRYRVGDRVGLLARVTDVHDKGNLSLEIEGTGGEQFAPPQYVHISEERLHAEADMIYITRQRRLADEGSDG